MILSLPRLLRALGLPLLFLADGSRLRAQLLPPLASPAPLTQPSPRSSAPAVALQIAAAERARDLGQLSVAIALYRELLSAPDADRDSLGLSLAAVLVDAGRAAEAQSVLSGISAPRGGAWQLRAGLAALQLRQRDAAQAAWNAIKPELLSPDDRPWYSFLQGALYDTLPNRDGAAVAKANEFYSKAASAGTTDLARARFQLAAERVRLQLAPPPRETLDQTRRVFEQWQGRVPGYEAARDYAVMLARLDRRGDAVQFLQRDVILTLPAQDRSGRDEFDFLIGLIGGARGPAGRASLFRLLASGVKPERQRQALQLLADASSAEPERSQFRAELNRHLAATPAHPIRESLLYFRAQIAVSERDFSQAEEDANSLLREFPGSPLRAHAQGVLTQSAWAAGRYRLAADYARRAREALPPGAETAAARFDLRVLEAEAWFRAGLQNPLQGSADFRYAADAYEAVLRDRPANLAPGLVGPLMFQRVLAEIKSGSSEAAEVLDRLGRDPAFDLENRWRAEWSLARALQIKGESAAAFARSARAVAALDPAGNVVPADLRARMAWLQARLAFETGQFRETLSLVDKVVQESAGLDPILRGEIASAGGLLKGRAQFALGQETSALETLKGLRATYPRSDAAVYSFLAESSHFEGQGNIVTAQLRLNELINNPDYARSDYLPYALFQTALLSEQLGGDDNLKAAIRRIEDLVNIPTAAAQDLLFRARLKQGDLLRRLNQFPQAQQAYEELINKFPQRPDVVLAHLSLAECLNARSAAEPAYAEIARLKFEELRDRLDAPADVRVEAGYNLGKLLERAGRLDEAATVWWRDVVVPFLQQAPAPGPDARRPYWLARTLLDYAALCETRGRLDEAREAYQLVVSAKLGAAEGLARQALQRLGTSPRN